MKKNKYITPKYPRVEVKPKMHKRLTAEAKKMGISIKELVDQKLNDFK